MKRKWFFGWSNIRWFIQEVGKIYSSSSSYFSKKRIESGVAFIIGQWGMIYFLIVNIDKMTASDIAIWGGMEFAIAGYMLTQIEKAKENTIETPPENTGAEEQINS
jgi:hypothetical protein